MKQNSSQKPRLDLLITYEFWEIHEAACILTSSWPECISHDFIPSSISNRTNRDFIFVPAKGEKALCSSTRKVLSDLENAIDDHQIYSIREDLLLKKYYNKNNSHFVLSRDVILWAIHKDYILPDELQNLTQFHQLKNKRKSIHERKVKIKIVGQYILLNWPNINIEEMCRHEWMIRYGAVNNKDFEFFRRPFDQIQNEIKQKDHSTIRRYLNEIFKDSGKKGRQVDIPIRGENRKHILNPLPEVMNKKDTGINGYNFPLLHIAIETSATLKMKIIKEHDLLKMNANQFVSECLKDEIIKLYTNECPEPILDLIKMYCTNVFLNPFVHPAIYDIPFSKRIQMSFSDLTTYQKDLFRPQTFEKSPS